MTIEVEAPDGSVVEFPDGTPLRTIQAIMRRQFGGQPPSAQPQQPPADVLSDVAGQSVRGVNRSFNAVLGIPGALVDKVSQPLSMALDAAGAVTGTNVSGAPVRDIVGRMQWRNNPVDTFLASRDVKPQTTAGRFADAIGQAVGASAIPSAALLRAAPAMAAIRPQSALQGVAQTIGQQVASAPGATLAADALAAVGSGVGSQVAREEQLGPGFEAVFGALGGMAPVAVAGASYGIRGPLREARYRQGATGARATVAEALPDGVDAFASGVARGTGAGGRSGEMRERTLRILGEEMAIANGNRRIAEAATLRRIAAEGGVTMDTARASLRSLRQQHRNNPLMLGEQPSVMGADDALRGPQGGLRRPANVDLDDLRRVQDSETRGMFDYLAAAGNARSSVTTRNALVNRNAELPRVVQDMFTRIQRGADSQGRVLKIDDVADMLRQATTAGRQAYEVAYNSPINNRLMLNTLPQLLQRYERQALGRAGAVRDALQNAVRQFYIQGPNGPVAMMTLRQLQDARSVVRGQLTSYYETPGMGPQARAVQQLYDRITALMEGMSPQWAVANRQWADLELERMGQQLGDALSTSPGPLYRRQLQQVERLAPQARDIVSVHYLEKLYNKIANAPDGQSVSKYFTRPHVRNTIRALFGDDAAVDFTRTMRDVQAAERTFQQGTRTHIRGEVSEQMERAQNIEAARQIWSLSGIADGFLKWSRQRLKEMRNRPLAATITTPMRDIDRVAMELEMMRQAQARLRGLAQLPPPAVPYSGVTGGVISSQDEER